MSSFTYDDGGRAAAGFKGEAGDCSTRAIAIATGRPYREVYDALTHLARTKHPRSGKKASARTGVPMTVLKDYLAAAGWRWIPTMSIGSGCAVHLTAAELPTGRLIVRVSRHLTAVIDGVIRDTYDPSRDGTRCVYGYWQEAAR